MHDIQAIYFTQTFEHKILNALFLGILGLIVTATIASDGLSQLVSIQTLIAITAPVVVIFVNTLAGPTCRTEILTAVSRVPLPSLRRVKTARKVLARLAPLIEEAQGRLDPGALENTLQEIQGQFTPPPVVTHSRPARLFALACYLLMTATGGLILLHCWLNGAATFVLLNLAMLGAMGTAIVTLVLNHYQNATRGPVALSWTALGYTCVHSVAVYVGMIVYGIFNQADHINDQMWLLKALATIPIQDSFPLFTTCAVLAVAALCIGLAGLLHTARKPTTAQP